MEPKELKQLKEELTNQLAESPDDKLISLKLTLVDGLLNVNSRLDTITKGLKDETIEASVTASKEAMKEQLAELEQFKEDTEKALASFQHPTTPEPGVIDEETGDPSAGYPILSNLFKDVRKAAEENVIPDRLRRYKAICEKKMIEMRAAGTGFEGDDAEFGGYILPVIHSSGIWQRAVEVSNIMDKVYPIPMGAVAIKIPAMGGYDRSGGTLFGGITFYDEPENDQIQDVRPKFEQIGFNLEMQAAMTNVSDKMLRFSPVTLESFISDRFAQALAWRIEYLLIHGTGAGQPQGILNCASKIEQAAEDNQAADTVCYENIVNMMARIWRENNAEWYFNRTVKPQLKTLPFVVGAGGERIKMEDALELPYHINEHCEAVGTVGDILLADWSQYGVALPQGQGGKPIFDTSIHFKFDYAQTSFRFIWYMDGHTMWRTYETPHKGDTIAPYVTLAAR